MMAWAGVRGIGVASSHSAIEIEQHARYVICEDATLFDWQDGMGTVGLGLR
jgi:hypothetical protein